ncbi:MAG: methyltransferase domain-containing protein [Desulfobacteraceae bacterium]|jgi:2-polyprenyl-6-hydroxyphenyl methylase/3-demethylubiquinone-9 3-methyltransferase
MDRNYYAKNLSASRLRRVYDLANSRVRQYLSAEIDHVASLINTGDHILELGCGYGRVLGALSESAGTRWGVDNSIESLRMARSEHPGLFLAMMDAGSLGFSNGSFDLVFGVQNFISACKVASERLLRECLRVVRPGGKVVLSSYAESFWPHRLEWFGQQAAEGLLGPIDEQATGDGVIVCRDGFRATTFSPGEFENLARSCGVKARIYPVDNASLFCEIPVPDVE